MRVPVDVLRSVCFVCIFDRSRGAYYPRGTGYFVTQTRGDGWPQTYLVTARHCVTSAAASADGSVHICINRKGGGFRYRKVDGNWCFPDDPAVDIAAIPYEPVDDDDVATIDSRQLLTAARIEKYAIDIGDDVWIAGLFKTVPGATRMRPVIRVGTIAAMPEEPIANTYANRGEPIPPYDAYLIEMRSIGGLSGSPVWVHLTYGRGYGANDPPPPLSLEELRRRKITGIFGGGDYTERLPNFLLGTIRLHWNAKPRDNEQLENLRDLADHGVVNMGIAAVTPIQALIDLLLRDDMLEARKARAEAFVRARGTSRTERSVIERGAAGHD